MYSLSTGRLMKLILAEHGRATAFKIFEAAWWFRRMQQRQKQKALVLQVTGILCIIYVWKVHVLGYIAYLLLLHVYVIIHYIAASGNNTRDIGITEIIVAIVGAILVLAVFVVVPIIIGIWLVLRHKRSTVSQPRESLSRSVVELNYCRVIALDCIQ